VVCCDQSEQQSIMQQQAKKLERKAEAQKPQNFLTEKNSRPLATVLTLLHSAVQPHALNFLISTLLFQPKHQN
jgi:hypothetical protein